jgi:hypothetical protein
MYMHTYPGTNKITDEMTDESKDERESPDPIENKINNKVEDSDDEDELYDDNEQDIIDMTTYNTNMKDIENNNKNDYRFVFLCALFGFYLYDLIW